MEDKNIDEEAPVAEEQEHEETVESTKQVPLEALESERARRQEAEAELRMYKRSAAKDDDDDEDDDDPDDIVTNGKLTKKQQEFKREVLEQSFCDSNPEHVKYINENLPSLIKSKPWVEDVVKSAPNRWARAYELLRDLSPKQANLTQAKRLEENARKPASPAAVGKSAQHSKAELLKSMAGKKEFREYRAQLLRGETT